MAKLQKITFVLSLIATLFLILLAQTTKQTQAGTIESIQYSPGKTTIQLKNNSAELILFDAQHTNLSKGDTIEFQGRRDIYKNKEQIIVDKLSCST